MGKDSSDSLIPLFPFVFVAQSASIVSDLKSEQRDLINLKQLASSIAKWDAECKELTQEISDIDMNLSLTGSTRTAKIVEADLARIAGEMWVPFFRLSLT